MTVSFETSEKWIPACAGMTPSPFQPRIPGEAFSYSKRRLHVCGANQVIDQLDWPSTTAKTLIGVILRTRKGHPPYSSPAVQAMHAPVPSADFMHAVLNRSSTNSNGLQPPPQPYSVSFPRRRESILNFFRR
jgi:hypothetical protein